MSTLTTSSVKEHVKFAWFTISCTEGCPDNAVVALPHDDGTKWSLARGFSSIPPDTTVTRCKAKLEEATHITNNYRLAKAIDHKPMDVARHRALITEKRYVDPSEQSLSSISTHHTHSY
ncbi:hypothetical protein VNO78_24679 [Psophocarpus tetragonolobus]|uniref:Uncharacterized protein n=1 Tax=Psophocarpus tetragonolobus TaxID=3891 RepID=A0AAN9S5Z7_PSOTE